MIKVDPVCGMQVEETTSQWSMDHEGETYCFCSWGCMLAFLEEPGQYIHEASVRLRMATGQTVPDGTSRGDWP